jgi:hypothetical protein
MVVDKGARRPLAFVELHEKISRICAIFLRTLVSAKRRTATEDAKRHPLKSMLRHCCLPFAFKQVNNAALLAIWSATSATWRCQRGGTVLNRVVKSNPNSFFLVFFLLNVGIL